MMYICSGASRCDELSCSHKKPHDIRSGDFKFDDCWKTACDFPGFEADEHDRIVCVEVQSPILPEELFEI